MANSKGDITLSVGLDGSDAESAAGSLTARIEKIFNRASGKKLSIGTQSLLQQLDALNTKMQGLRDKMRDIETTEVKNPVIEELEEQINDAYSSAESLGRAIQNIYEQYGKPTAEYTGLQKIVSDYEFAKQELDKAILRDKRSGTTKSARAVTKWTQEVNNLEDAANKARERMQELEDSGKHVTLPSGYSEQVSNLNEEMEETLNTAEQLESELQALRDAGEPETVSQAEADSEQYDRLGESVNGVTNKITLYLAKLRETEDGANLDAEETGWVSLGTAIARVLQFIVKVPLDVGKAVGSAGLGLLKNVLIGIAEKAKAAAKSLAQMVSQKIKQGASKLASSLFGLRKNIDNANGGFKHGLRTIIKYAFGVRSLFFLIRRLRTLLLTGLQGMGQAWSPLGNAITSLKTALNGLKGAFISAVAPVAMYVIPILTSLINIITGVINKVGMLIAALTGQSKYIKANVVPATDEACNSASNAADATDKYKKTLAGFDDVEIISDPTKNNGAGGGGNGAGAGDNSWTVEELPIDGTIKDLAQKIRDLIANQDWEGLGTFLGEQINSIFIKAKNLLESTKLQEKISSIINAVTTTVNALANSINWELIGETFGAGINLIIHAANQLLTGIDWKAIGEDVARAFNGLFDKVDWAGIGEFFSNKLNVIVDAVSGFVTKFNWKENASKFTQGLNSFVNNIHWSEAATAISKGFKGVLSALTTVIQEFDWKGLGNKIAKFIGEIDWSGIIEETIKTLSSLQAGLQEFLIGLIEPAWNGLIDWWKGVAFEDGKFAIEGLLDGIVDALKNIGKWIKEHIFDPFIEGFKGVFEISSPSKVMKKMGKYIIDGLLEGISDTWTSITKFFTSAIKKLGKFFSNPIGSIKVAIDSSVTMAQNVWNGFKNSTVVKTLKEVGSSTISKALGIWDSIKNSAATKTLREIGGSTISRVKSVWDGLKNSSVVKTLRETGSATINRVKTAIWDKISSGVVMKTLRSTIDRTFTNAKNTYDSMVSKTINVVARATRFQNNLGYTPTISVKAQVTRVSGFSSFGSSVLGYYGRAAGGAFFNGIWHNIPQYASGTLNARGSMFVAGESGPEVVGHIGGRTEVLNQSQLAATMYASVHSAVAQVATAILQNVSSVLIACANGIVTAINSFEYALPNMIPTTISVPEIATGYVVPSMAQIAAVQRNSELLAGAVESLNAENTNRLTNDDLERIIERVLKRCLNIQFYLGDEQIARHANAGNEKLSLRYNNASIKR